VLTSIREWLAEWLGLLVGIVLIIVGVVGHFKLHEYLLLRSLSEALLIAGILTLTVDPFIKRRLLREASKDIFRHMLGFALPDEIKERLNSIVFNTTTHLKNTPFPRTL
jgi:hypothetical protein